MTPLQHAIKHNLVSVVRVLVSSGANLLTPYQGKTPIENSHNKEIQEILSQAISFLECT